MTLDVLKTPATTLRGMLFCLALLAANAWADTVRVLAAEQFEAPLKDLAQPFHNRTKHTVTFTFASGEDIQKRLAGGEAADAVVVNKTLLDALEEAKLTVHGARIDFAQAPANPHHGDNPPTFTGGIVMHTPVAPAAVSFIRFLTSPEAQQRLVEAGFAVPQAAER